MSYDSSGSLPLEAFVLDDCIELFFKFRKLCMGIVYPRNLLETVSLESLEDTIL